MTKFFPESVPYTDDMGFIREFLGRQFNLILAAFEAVEQIELQELNIEPERPREGMIKFADGVNWNPGGGRGFYGFDGTIWRKLDEIGTASGVETGDWTPGLEFGNATTGITYGARTARYIKVGPLVHVNIDLAITSKGTATGDARITGLPFTCEDWSPLAVGFYSAFTGLTGAITAYTENLTTEVVLRQTGAASTATLTDTSFTNTSRIIIGGTYEVDL